MVQFFIEIYWSLVEVILKYYLESVKCDFVEISTKYDVSNMFST